MDNGLAWRENGRFYQLKMPSEQARIRILTGEEHGRWALMVCLLALVTGAALLIGFLTPLAALLAGLVGLGLTLSWLSPFSPNGFGGSPATIFLIVMAAAVLLLGPGAYSLDARWFGRREIVIPRDDRA